MSSTGGLVVLGLFAFSCLIISMVGWTISASNPYCDLHGDWDNVMRPNGTLYHASAHSYRVAPDGMLVEIPQTEHLGMGLMLRPEGFYTTMNKRGWAVLDVEVDKQGRTTTKWVKNPQRITPTLKELLLHELSEIVND